MTKPKKLTDALVAVATLATGAPVSHFRTLLGAIFANASDQALQDAYKELPVELLGDRHAELERQVAALRQDFLSFKVRWTTPGESLSAEDVTVFDWLYKKMLDVDAQGKSFNPAQFLYREIEPESPLDAEDLTESLRALEEAGFVKLHWSHRGLTHVQMRLEGIFSYSLKLDPDFESLCWRVANQIVDRPSTRMFTSKPFAKTEGASHLLLLAILNNFESRGLVRARQFTDGNVLVESHTVGLKRLVRQQSGAG